MLVHFDVGRRALVARRRRVVVGRDAGAVCVANHDDAKAAEEGRGAQLVEARTARHRARRGAALHRARRTAAERQDGAAVGGRARRLRGGEDGRRLVGEDEAFIRRRVLLRIRREPDDGDARRRHRRREAAQRGAVVSVERRLDGHRHPLISRVEAAAVPVAAARVARRPHGDQRAAVDRTARRRQALVAELGAHRESVEGRLEHTDVRKARRAAVRAAAVRVTVDVDLPAVPRPKVLVVERPVGGAVVIVGRRGAGRPLGECEREGRGGARERLRRTPSLAARPTDGVVLLAVERDQQPAVRAVRGRREAAQVLAHRHRLRLGGLEVVDRVRQIGGHVDRSGEAAEAVRALGEAGGANEDEGAAGGGAGGGESGGEDGRPVVRKVERRRVLLTVERDGEGRGVARRQQRRPQP